MNYTKINQNLLMGVLISAILISLTAEARTEITLESSIYLSAIEDNDLSIKVLYPGMDPGWGVCGISVTAWDAAPEFTQFANALEITNETGDPISVKINSQEPQGSIEIDFTDHSGAFLLNVGIKTKTGETMTKISKRVFGPKAVLAYPVFCEPIKLKTIFEI